MPSEQPDDNSVVLVERSAREKLIDRARACIARRFEDDIYSDLLSHALTQQQLIAEMIGYLSAQEEFAYMPLIPSNPKESK